MISLALIQPISTLIINPIVYAVPTQMGYEGSEFLLKGGYNLDHEKVMNRNISYY